MPSLNPATLLEALHWRYATKQFDPSRKIPEQVWKSLEEALVLSPSSYGLQPYHFIVVKDPALRSKLRTVSWNQSQVVDASHLLVLAYHRKLDAAWADAFLNRVMEVRGVTKESLEGYRQAILGDLVGGPRSQWSDHWAARQLYIAYGNLMTSAALLGVDTCPLEGLDPAEYDKILGLEGTPWKTAAALTLGYRGEGDKYASLAKVRFPAESLIEYR